MTEPSSATQPLSARTAQILHSAMVAGVVVIAIVFGMLGRLAPLGHLEELVTLFRFVAVAELAMAAVVMRLMRARLEPLRRGGEPDAWWGRFGSRAILIWALAEGSAVFGAVLWFLTGDVVLLAGVTGIALILLVMHRPRTLTEG